MSKQKRTTIVGRLLEVRVPVGRPTFEVSVVVLDSPKGSDPNLPPPEYQLYGAEISVNGGAVNHSGLMEWLMRANTPVRVSVVTETNSYQPVVSADFTIAPQ